MERGDFVQIYLFHTNGIRLKKKRIYIRCLSLNPFKGLISVKWKPLNWHLIALCHFCFSFIANNTYCQNNVEATFGMLDWEVSTVHHVCAWFYLRWNDRILERRIEKCSRVTDDANMDRQWTTRPCGISLTPEFSTNKTTGTKWLHIKCVWFQLMKKQTHTELICSH